MLASTSEIFSHVGRSWQGNNPENDSSVIRERFNDREDLGVKSEFGVNSEESGYKSEETRTVVSSDEPSRNLSNVPGHFPGTESEIETSDRAGNPSCHTRCETFQSISHGKAVHTIHRSCKHSIPHEK